MVDPECMIDACKMKMIKKMMTKEKQPWMKWVERKMENKRVEWGMWGSVLGARMTKKRMKELNDECYVESMMKIWYEMGGTTRYAYENMREESEEEERKREELMEEVRNLLEVTDPAGREKREEEREERRKRERRVGVVVEGRGFVDIDALETRDVYDILMTKRKRRGTEEPRQTWTTLDRIQKRMTAKERDYWWRMTHGLISLKKTESKWKRDEDEEMTENLCPVCKQTKKDRQHYDFDCEMIQQYISNITPIISRQQQQEIEAAASNSSSSNSSKQCRWYGAGLDRFYECSCGECTEEGEYTVRITPAAVVSKQAVDQTISREEWSLAEANISNARALVIAKARWIYHKERCRVDHRQRKTINTAVLVAKLERALATSLAI